MPDELLCPSVLEAVFFGCLTLALYNFSLQSEFVEVLASTRAEKLYYVCIMLITNFDAFVHLVSFL